MVTVTRVNLIIPPERIADMVITALEGGSNYWCTKVMLRRAAKRAELKERPWYANPTLYLNGGYIIHAYELEDERSNQTKEHRVTPRSISEGFHLMAKHSPSHFGDFLAENEDATTADVWWQYVVLGEVIYG